MVKINKKFEARHKPTLSPMIADFVHVTTKIPLYQLPAHLASFPKLWPFPRGDLYHWIPVLDRFDTILELFTKEYGLVDGPQTQPFERRLLLKGDQAADADSPPEPATNAILDGLHLPRDGDRALIEQILAFSRLLVENCGNRTLYSSSAHLEKLLNTTCLSLVEATLKLGLRLAQRFNVARQRGHHASFLASTLANHYNIDLEHVQKLTGPLARGPSMSPPVFGTPIGKGKERTFGDRRSELEKTNPADLVKLLGLPEPALKQEFGGVAVSYYEPSATTEQGAAKQDTAEAPMTPAPARRTLNFQQTPRQAHPLSNVESPTTPVTPGFGESDSGRASGAKTFDLSVETVSKMDIHELLKQGLATLPKATHYEFLVKLRNAKAIQDGRREDAVAVRLLAIANLGYIYDDKVFWPKLGQQDADEPRRLQLAYQLCELVHPPGEDAPAVSRNLQTLALNTLESWVKHKSKAPDVCQALSVNVNHGVLFYIVRKAVAELAAEGEIAEGQEEWREALFSLLNTLPTAQQRTGEGMVSAGLLEILVEVLTLRTKQAERNYARSLQFLDTFVYNLRDAFQALVTAKGLDIVSDLTSHMVSSSKALAEEGKGMPAEYKTQFTDYRIPFYHQQTLRWLFKFMNHMLSHTGGTTDRLMRNFMDSQQLLGALRTVLSHPQVYGSTVWSLSSSILTNFIHNEPTSYAVIAEAGLSEAFLETVAREPTAEQTESGVLPVAEAMHSIPQTFGAICIAEAGMKLFQSSNALQRFFDIFTGPSHISALDTDPEMASVIGASFDELVRHHPPLKEKVLACVGDMVKRISATCATKAAEEGFGDKLWVESEDGTVSISGGRKALGRRQTLDQKDTPTSSGIPGEDIEIRDADEQAADDTANEQVTLDQLVETELNPKKPVPSQYIRILCRFLHGFFGNQSICAAYIEAHGVESILDLATLPSLSLENTENSVVDTATTTDEYSRVVQTLLEQKPHIAIPAMLKRAQQALDRLEPFMSHSGNDGFFAPFTACSPSELKDHPRRGILEHGTDYVKSMVSVYVFVSALKQTFQGQMYPQRSSQSFASQVNLADMYARIVYSLGRLDRSCVWEEILLQKNMPPEWEQDTRLKEPGLAATEIEDLLGRRDEGPSSEPRGDLTPAARPSVESPTGPTSNAPAPQDASHEKSARFRNTRTLRCLLSKLPLEVAPFCQQLGKVVLMRRSIDSHYKQCAILVADQLAQAAIDQINFPGPERSDLLSDRYAYWVVILDSILQLIIDDHSLDRTTQVLTLILVSFKNLDGMNVLSELLDTFCETAAAKAKTPSDEIKEDDRKLLNLSLAGIRIILDLFSQIINNKVISESTQTGSLQTRTGSGDRERADHFTAAQFLVDLRYAITKSVKRIWNSDLMDNANTTVVKVTISILKTVLEADGEHTAYKRKDDVHQRRKPTFKPWSPRSSDLVNRLKESDIDEELATEALYRCNDNLNAAREYCQNQKARPSRNPIPSYEVRQKPPSTDHWAGVVPGPADRTHDDTSDESSGSENENEHDESSVAGSAPDTNDDVNQVPSAQDSTTEQAPQITESAKPSDVSWEFLAYLKRTRQGDAVQPVSVEELDEERSGLRNNLIDRALDILNSHDDVTFDLSDLISAAVAKASDPATMRSEIGTILVQSLISLQNGEDFREQGKKIAASAHLLALVIQETDFYEAVVEDLKDSFTTLLGFIKIYPDHPQDESSPWVGQVLLIVERLLAEDQLPRLIKWTPPSPGETEDVSVEGIPEPVFTMEQKTQLFDALLEVLPRIRKDESLALSVTRVLVMLTRTRKLATRMAEKRNIMRLFLMVRQLSGITNEGLRTAFMIVLRHIIEDEETIRDFMRTEIQIQFESRERRQMDTTAYTRGMFYLALRDPEIFVEVTNEKLQLARFDSAQRPQSLILKREEPAAPPSEPTVPDSAENTTQGDKGEVKESQEPIESKEITKAPALERRQTSELKPPVVKNPDGVIHYLLCELLAYKEVEDTPEAPKTTDTKFQETKSPESNAAESNAAESGSTASAEPSSPSAPDTQAATAGSTTDAAKSQEKFEFKAESHPIFIYRCFLLKCLAELLQSYNRTKIEFINFSRKADAHTSTPSKPRSGVLNYLLTTLIPVGTIAREGDVSFKKRLATSNCAIDVIVSLCTKTTQHKTTHDQASPYTDTESDLLFVRKFVLEHALKAFKDASASDEPFDMKYSRLMNLSDLFSRMISQRADGQFMSETAGTAALGPALKQMAKVMYEKNFITVLTSAIADIDLNFPDAKRVVKYILKPLKWLCGVAADLSMHYDTDSAPGATDEHEISSASDDEMMETTREETPDLFRNSTLSMFEAAHESESEDEDDHDDEEMYEEAYDDEEMYDEEMDDEDVVSEEDEEMGEMGPIEGLPGDVEMEIIEDGEEIMSDDEDDSDDSDDDEDDDEDDDDMDDMQEVDDMEELEEITGDDENASLEDNSEDGWDGEDGDFGASDDIHVGDMAPPLGFGDLFVGGGHGHVHPPHDGLTGFPGRLEHLIDEGAGDEGEDEEDEEDYDDEINYYDYDAGLEEDEDLLHDIDNWNMTRGLGRPMAGGRIGGLSPWFFPGGPSDRITAPLHRTYRSGVSARHATEEGVNPLLQRSGRGMARGMDAGFGRIHHSHDNPHEWVATIIGRPGEGASADSPASFLNSLFNAMSQGGPHGSFLAQHGGGVQLSIGGNTQVIGLPPPFDPSFRRDTRHYRDTHLHRSSREDPQSAVAFQKAFTIKRWGEEAGILYGNAASEKAQLTINSILKLLVPPAIEAAKRKAEEEAEARRIRKEKQEREEREAKEREEKERQERKAKEREEQEQRERELREAAERQAQEYARAAEGEATQAPSEGQAMEGVEGAQISAEQPAEAPTERVSRIINVQGQDVDVGALGIDLEYLEALPEELREEVLIQQITEHRLQNQESQAGGDVPADIDPAFLDALPPNLREEVLQQEAQERRRREREESRRRALANGGGVQADDMAPADFLASLDPELRHLILGEQSDDVLRNLPAQIAEEARQIGGDRRLNQFHDFPGTRPRARDGHHDDQVQKRKARPCVQMLDKSGVATLLRLMFIPQTGSAKTGLSAILRNVCENRQNRAEVISLLLSILQDGTADVNAVERSFAQLSIRAKQSPYGADKTPKFSRKSGTFTISSDVSPLLVVQQCLSLLKELVQGNPPVWSFFLTEHETAVGFRNRKGKGKAKDNKATKYPINALLGLLERRLVVESSSLMEQLTSLLRTITSPLTVLKKQKEEEKKEEQRKVEEAQAAAAQQSSTEQAQAQTQGAPAQSEDTEMVPAPEAPTAEGEASRTEDKPAEEDKSKKHRTMVPPEVPENNLRLVAKILAARECNSKVFQETLSIINNLSPIPGAKEVFGKELLGIAQDLAQTTLTDLANLTAQITKAETSTDVQGMALSKFSPQSSDQTKLLRALTALDYLFNPSAHKDKGDTTEALEPAQKEDILLTLYESSTFAGLWKELSQFLTIIRERGNMLSIATILLPLVEALMVVCKNTTLKEPLIGKNVGKEFGFASPAPDNKMESLFFDFTEEHRKVLNDLVRQNPKLMSGTFSLLVKNSKVLEFDNKRNYFTRKLHARHTEQARGPHPPLQLSVRRDQVFLDSFKSLYFKSAEEMKYGKLNIRFHGEEGVDAGGVTREWFQVIARQMFDPNYALFVPVASDRTTFHPNQNSSVNPEHLMFFKFIGRIIGKALYEGRVLDCYFSRAVYKRILGKSVNVKDMETLDPDYYKSLQWMLENDITDIITETFSVDVDTFGVIKTVDLIENGRNIPVTEDNKHEYVRLVTEHRLTGAVSEQLDQFLKGFHDIVPAELVAIFSEQELELLISGLPDINVDDWKNNTEYHNYTAASPQIQWFWRAVRSFDAEERAKLLQFVTGTSKVPLNGFKELEGMNGFSRFNIHRDYGSKNRLPSSHTCFNQLDLPEYESYEDLRKQLYTAMTAGGEYFGFA